MDSQYCLVQIKPQNFNAVREFISNNYVGSEPLSFFWKTTPQQFSDIYGELLADACKSGLSFMFSKEGKIVSALLIVTYQDYMRPVPVPQQFYPIQSLFQKVQQNYSPKNPQKSLYLCVAYTLPEHRRKGLFKKLVEKIQNQAKQKGFVEILADCTNPNSEKNLKKIGYEQRTAVYYKDYECRGVKFDGVVGSEKLCLITKHI